MIRAELRYLGGTLWIVGVFIVSPVLAIAIGSSTHLDVTAVGALALVFIFALGVASLVVWLKYVPKEPTENSARYVPLGISATITVAMIYLVVVSIRTVNVADWRHGFSSLGLLCISTAVSAWTTYTSCRAFSRRVPDARATSSFQRRLDDYAAAYALPDGPERTRRVRHIRTRGFVRLGLLAAEVVLFVVLAPLLGPILALVVSFAVVALTFLVLHWRFDL